MKQSVIQRVFTVETYVRKKPYTNRMANLAVSFLSCMNVKQSVIQRVLTVETFVRQKSYEKCYGIQQSVFRCFRLFIINNTVTGV